MHSRLLGMNGFHVKAACRVAFQVWKFHLVTWQARSKNCTKKHSAYGRPRLFFLIQAIKSLINMALSLPFLSLFLKHPTYLWWFSLHLPLPEMINSIWATFCYFQRWVVFCQAAWKPNCRHYWCIVTLWRSLWL